MPKGHQIHVLLAFAKRTGKRNELGLIVAPLALTVFGKLNCSCTELRRSSARPSWGRRRSAFRWRLRRGCFPTNSSESCKAVVEPVAEELYVAQLPNPHLHRS